MGAVGLMQVACSHLKYLGLWKVQSYDTDTASQPQSDGKVLKMKATSYFCGYSILQLKHKLNEFVQVINKLPSSSCFKFIKRSSALEKLKLFKNSHK